MGRSFGDLAVFIGKRFLQLIPVLLGIIVIAFVLTHLAVRDPCAYWASRARPNALRACITYFGLTQPLTTQFGTYFLHLLGGDWGYDPNNGAPVLPAIQSAFPAT